VEYSAVVWRNDELDANIRQSPSPATDGMGTAQYGLDFTGPNISITANLDFGRLQRAVCPRTQQREELLVPCGHLPKPVPDGCSETGGTGLVGAVAGSYRRSRNAGPNGGLRWSSRLGAAPSAENRLIRHV
jgi:hypothetical protein